MRAILSVTNDQGLHAWLTLSIMVIFSSACFVLAARGPTLAWLWTGLLFLGLSADDYTKFHQNLGAIVGSWFQTTVSWQIVVGPILAACGLAVFLQLRKVITARGERLVVLAGFGCLAAALGMEALEMVLTKSEVTWLGLDSARYVQPIDEFLELLARPSSSHAHSADSNNKVCSQSPLSRIPLGGDENTRRRGGSGSEAASATLAMGTQGQLFPIRWSRRPRNIDRLLVAQMNQSEVVRILGEMASLLEIVEANSFEIMAFRNASRSLKDWAGDLTAAVEGEALTDIEGVGKGIAKIITQLVTTGSAEDHVELRAKFPDGLPDLLRLSGIGPKKVKVLWKELGIENLDALEEAAKAGEVANLRGFGAKTAEKMLKGIDWLRKNGERKSAPSTKQLRQPAVAREPAAASTGRLRAGTSGYSYDAWKGSFYPEDAGKDHFLGHYAAQLSTVEINNSFYRFPTQKVLSQWAGQVPEDFQFTVKANQRITHRHRLKNAAEVTTSFVERCQVLGARLGCILFQLPPNLEREDDRLETFLASLPAGVRYAIEFRHVSWFEQPVFEMLSTNHVALVLHDGDEQDKRGTDVACPRELTTNFTYVRLRRDHYDDAALDDWRSWLRQQTQANQDAFVYIKHDDDGTSPLDILNRMTGVEIAPGKRKSAKSASSAKRKTKRTRPA